MDRERKESDIRIIFEAISKQSYVRPEEIPDIPLYMDQVTSFLDEKLSPFKRFDEDKLLTKTMINNYTKNNLLPPPEKKKYSKNHMILLIFIYYMKHFLSISDIKKIFAPLSERFFEDESDLDIEDIYKYVFDMEVKGMDVIAKDVYKKFNISKTAFPKLENEEDNEILSTFAYICMLSFDVYVKKIIIETLIDNRFNENTDDKDGKDKKDSK